MAHDHRSPKDRARHAAGTRFALMGATGIAIGILLIVLLDGAFQTLGIVLAFLASVPATVGAALLMGSLVSWWSEREKPFA